jgi:hypothetical protein
MTSFVLGAIAPVSITTALAAPPTVTPSPGYDARLQDSRKAPAATSATVVDPATPPAPTPPRHRSKRKQ